MKVGEATLAICIFDDPLHKWNVQLQGLQVIIKCLKYNYFFYPPSNSSYRILFPRALSHPVRAIVNFIKCGNILTRTRRAIMELAFLLKHRIEVKPDVQEIHFHLILFCGVSVLMSKGCYTDLKQNI